MNSVNLDITKDTIYKMGINSLTYNVSVKSRNLSIVLSVYCMYIQILVVGYVGFYVELSFPIKNICNKTD